MKSEESYRDPIIKRLYDEAGAVQPAPQFAERVLKQIKANSGQSSLVYSPVISRKMWMVIVAAICVMAVVLFYSANAQETSQLQFVDNYFRTGVGLLQKMTEKVMLSMEFSPIMKTSLVALAIFTFVQLFAFEWRNRTFFK